MFMLSLLCLYELVARKPAFCICENKDADQLRGNREADQRLCFRYIESKSLFYLNAKFQASSQPLWLYSPVCVGPGRKPRRPVFSQRGSYVNRGFFLLVVFGIGCAFYCGTFYNSCICNVHGAIGLPLNLSTVLDKHETALAPTEFVLLFHFFF